MKSSDRKGSFSFFSIIFLLYLAGVITLALLYLRIESASGSLDMQKSGLRYAAESGGNYALAYLADKGIPEEEQVWHLAFPEEQADVLEVSCSPRENGCQIISTARKERVLVKIRWLVDVEKTVPYKVKVKEVRG